MSEVWDIPMIGCPAASLGTNAARSDFTTVSRTSITYAPIASVLLRFFDAFNYTSPVFLLDQKLNFYLTMGTLVQAHLMTSSLKYGVLFILYNSDEDDGNSIKHRLLQASKTSRGTDQRPVDNHICHTPIVQCARTECT